jgi:phospholipid-binding lipoprotein MlaA
VFSDSGYPVSPGQNHPAATAPHLAVPDPDAPNPQPAPAITPPAADRQPEEAIHPYGGKVPFPQTINDPIEGYNRAMFAFNDQLIKLIVNPLATGYRAIAPEPVRKSIRKAGINLGYPVRLINTLLQGKNMGALSETGRFLVNSTIGLLGLFDPATKFGMPAYNEDFGQTFGHYGYDFGFYFVLPYFGSSSGRDSLGWIFDLAFNPTTYFGGTFFSFNDMSFKLPTYMQLRTVERDPYAIMREFMAIKRRKEVADYAIKADQVDPDPTLKSILLKLQDKEFPKRMVEYKAVIPATGKKLPYSAWIQANPAPLVYVLGGVGSHRMSESTMALAEILYNDRFSVVTISSAMNWEFMENAATAAVPGYPVTDA